MTTQDLQFELLRREMYFVEATLGGGFNDLSSSGERLPGMIFSGLLGVSQGLERLLKVTIAVSRFTTDGAFPTERVFRYEMGHNLGELYNQLRSEDVAAGIDWSVSQSTLGIKFLGFLTQFATATRYFNLDNLDRPSGGPGPLENWRRLLVDVAEEEKWYRDRFGECDWVAEGVSAFDHPSSNTRELLRRATPSVIGHLAMLVSPVVLTLQEGCCRATSLPSEKADAVPFLEEFLPHWPEDFAEAKRRKQWRWFIDKV